jgi:hypothetical protein
MYSSSLNKLIFYKFKHQHLTMGRELDSESGICKAEGKELRAKDNPTEESRTHICKRDHPHK